MSIMNRKSIEARMILYKDYQVSLWLWALPFFTSNKDETDSAIHIKTLIYLSRFHKATYIYQSGQNVVFSGDRIIKHITPIRL